MRTQIFTHKFYIERAHIHHTEKVHPLRGGVQLLVKMEAKEAFHLVGRTTQISLLND